MDAATFAQHAAVEEKHWWFTARRTILRDVLGQIGGGAGTALLDVGCGTGGNAAAFAAAGYRVLGLDPSADAIGHARRRFPGVAFQQAQTAAVGRDHLASGGIALLADVLEHVEDDRGLLRQVVEVVPPGGSIVITVPADLALWSPHDISFGHFRRYDTRTLAALWRDVPVEVRLLSPFNARLRPMIAAIRRIRRGRPATRGGDLEIPTGAFNSVLRSIFAGESARLLGALDTGRPAFRRGVSLIAVLRRT